MLQFYFVLYRSFGFVFHLRNAEISPPASHFNGFLFDLFLQEHFFVLCGRFYISYLTSPPKSCFRRFYSGVVKVQSVYYRRSHLEMYLKVIFLSSRIFLLIHGINFIFSWPRGSVLTVLSSFLDFS